MAAKDAPTRELGAPGITSHHGLLDTWETTGELVWPNSVHVYDRMRRDPHVAAGLRAVKLPVLRNTYKLLPDTEVRPEVYDLVRRDLGLEDQGRRRRRREGIVWRDFVRHALLALDFGHMFFEQVYELIDGVAHLRKLGPRMPRTIAGWDIAADGGLNAITQWKHRPNGFWDEVRIPIDRLVVFCNEREGSDWSGQSLLRTAYKPWLIGDGLSRVDAMGGERNAMGIPVVEYDPAKMTKTEALEIAKNVRAGEEAGVVFEQGAAAFRLAGVDGELRDLLPSMRFHQQAVSRAFMAMFLDLGHDNGARSLGDTFLSFFVLCEQTISDWIADITTEHVIRDLVETNFGPDEAYPLLEADEITADAAPTAEAMKQLAEAGYILPDAELEVQLRRRYGWPIPPGLPTEPGPALPPVTDVDPDAARTPEAGATIEELEARLARLKAGPRSVPTSRLPSAP